MGDCAPEGQRHIRLQRPALPGWMRQGGQSQERPHGRLSVQGATGPVAGGRNPSFLQAGLDAEAQGIADKRCQHRNLSRRDSLPFDEPLDLRHSPLDHLGIKPVCTFGEYNRAPVRQTGCFVVGIRLLPAIAGLTKNGPVDAPDHRR